MYAQPHAQAHGSHGSHGPQGAPDPHQVLNLPREFTLEQLKFHYKTLARQLHPDKTGGRLAPELANATFQTLTHAYQTLLEQTKNRAQSQCFDQLRAGSRAYTQESHRSPPPSSTSYAPTPPSAFPDRGHSNNNKNNNNRGPPPAAPLRRPRSSPEVEGKNFDPVRFNDVFSQTRQEDPAHDAGYADWMEKTDAAADESMQRLQIARYVEPEPLVITNSGRSMTAFTELGVSKISDFSRNDGSGRRSVQYSDYRIAHTTRKLGDEALLSERQAFATVDDLKADRARVSYTMTDEDLRKEARMKRMQAEEQERRQRVCMQRDTLMQRQYERAHQALLGYAP
jgi:curved DNA-binding protein CbpA